MPSGKKKPGGKNVVIAAKAHRDAEAASRRRNRLKRAQKAEQ